MNKKYSDNLYSYIKANRIKFFLVILSLFSGIITGAILSAVSLSENFNDQYLKNFISAYNLQGAIPTEVFKNAIFSNLRLVLCIWISGTFIWLSPLILIECLFKGFGMGYTIAYLSAVGGFKGFLLSALSLSVQNIVFIPAIMIFSVMQINFSKKMHRLKSSSHYKQRKKLIKNNICAFGIMLVIGTICSVLEAYLVPLLIKPICGNF
ncbi:MAG: stage II sporulation protein M [Clostridia bacterium]|nr:stage II sporulation protein M [Clostridia bacterium]